MVSGIKLTLSGWLESLELCKNLPYGGGALSVHDRLSVARNGVLQVMTIMEAWLGELWPKSRLLHGWPLAELVLAHKHSNCKTEDHLVWTFIETGVKSVPLAVSCGYERANKEVGGLEIYLLCFLIFMVVITCKFFRNSS